MTKQSVTGYTIEDAIMDSINEKRAILIGQVFGSKGWDAWKSVLDYHCGNRISLPNKIQFDGRDAMGAYWEIHLYTMPAE